jgi:hypothetical protein
VDTRKKCYADVATLCHEEEKGGKIKMTEILKIKRGK